MQPATENRPRAFSRWNEPPSLRVNHTTNLGVADERGAKPMFNFSTTHLFAVAGIAALLATGAQAFDGGSPSGLMNRQVQPASLPTDVQREVQPTRTIVDDPTGERAGTITIDTKNRYLYLSMERGRAMRYDVGVGREGFAWSGRAHIGRRAEWPSWTPPAAMLLRRPDLPRVMEGGLANPLGARAMYLYNSHGDTMFRIHGTNEPDTIGRAVSSGCIRLLNDDVVDLYSRVKIGAPVVVL
jgi:lipoprotein-anchoring transpeptidase ErfK/SrfK